LRKKLDEENHITYTLYFLVIVLIIVIKLQRSWAMC